MSVVLRQYSETRPITEGLAIVGPTLVTEHLYIIGIWCKCWADGLQIPTIAKPHRYNPPCRSYFQVHGLQFFDIESLRKPGWPIKQYRYLVEKEI